MLVKEAMSSKVETISPVSTIRQCAHKMDQLGVGAFVVSEHGKTIGIVTDRDVCCRGIGAAKDPATISVRDVMTCDVASCFDDQHCTEAARIMEEKHVRRLAVVNRNHALVGLFSIDDLARYSHDLAGGVLDAAAPWPH